MKIVEFPTNKDTGIRDEMLGLLTRVTERVRSGEVTGIVILQTTDGSITYNSAGGRCLSSNMLGLMFNTALQISNTINDTSEDVK